MQSLVERAGSEADTGNRNATTLAQERVAAAATHATCPLCENDDPEPGSWFDFPPFRVVRCRACRLWYLSPRLPEDLMLEAYARPEYYLGRSVHGYSNDAGSYFEQEPALRATFRRFLQALAGAGLTGGRLLDVGAGQGYLLDEARGLFAERTGTDYNTEAVQSIEAFGCRGIVGGVEHLPADAKFDLIVAVGVIEHVYRPAAFVAALKDHLASGGSLVLASPFANSLWFRVLGRRWPSFKIPEHVAYYDQITLRHLFQRCGLTQTRTFPYLHAFPLGLLVGWFGIGVPHQLARLCIWVPHTMVAVGATTSTEEGSS
jgi:2-polyprenyl-3-methyl-5-hydroxy-6-metoxy-1,4-benzoquinol methylase